jgi:hypothetical protein
MYTYILVYGVLRIDSDNFLLVAKERIVENL